MHAGVSVPRAPGNVSDGIVGADVGHDDVADVLDADAIAGTDDLDRGLRQRRFPGPDRELRWRHDQRRAVPPCLGPLDDLADRERRDRKISVGG